MSYYTALINAWNTSSASAGALPSGVTGTSLFGLSTAAKISAVNGWTIAAAQPAILSVTNILNAIVAADFLALTSTQIAQMQLLLMSGGGGTVNASPGTTVRGVFQSIFGSKATTLANLSALVAPYDNATGSWLVANGYSVTISTSDTGPAGLA